MYTLLSPRNPPTEPPPAGCPQLVSLGPGHTSAPVEIAFDRVHRRRRQRRSSGPMRSNSFIPLRHRVQDASAPIRRRVRSRGPHLPPPGHVGPRGHRERSRELSEARGDRDRRALHHAVHVLHLRRERVDARLRLPVAVAQDEREEEDGDRRDGGDRDARDAARLVHAHPVHRDEERDEPGWRVEGQTL